MLENLTTNRTMGALLVVDLGLLALSGIPAFKEADGGWKWIVGGAAWLGFVVLSVVLLGLAATAIMRRRKAQRTVTRSSAPVADRGRRTALVGAAALAVAMLADLAEFVLDPASSGEAATIANASVVHHDRMVISGYLLLASAIFVYPGVALLTRGLRERGRRLGRVALVLGFVGALGHAALATAYIAWAAMPGEGTDQAQVTAVLERMTGSAALAPFAIGFIAFPLAIIATLGSLVRARVAPKWLLVPVVAAPVAASAPLGAVDGTIVALCLLLGSTAVVAARIARGVPTAGVSQPAAGVALAPTPS